jgi:branched-chain amino acid aminotransferase
MARWYRWIQAGIQVGLREAPSAPSLLRFSYAAGIVPQSEAAKQGYSQNLWLVTSHFSETSTADPLQVGTMNLFVAFKKPDGTVELATPPLGDTILPGVTRDRLVGTGT